MKTGIIISILTLGLFAVLVWAKTEDPTSLVKPVSLYGTYNGSIVPIQVASDGSLVLH